MTTDELIELANNAYIAAKNGNKHQKDAIAQAVIIAIAPHIRAEALREGAEHLRTLYDATDADRSEYTDGYKWALEKAERDLVTLANAVAPDGGGWLPIESAPHGVEVLVFFGKRRWVAYLTEKTEGIMSTWRNAHNGTCLGWPTHWQPLPAPPRNDEKGEG